MQQQDIKVWDIFVRFFHWALVLAFTVSFVSEDDFMRVHAYAGYFIGVLLLMRVFWGLIGSRYARFSDFVKPPEVVGEHLKDVIHFRSKRYIGHNPLGGWMIVALMITLSLTAMTGLVAYAGEEQSGPLAFLAYGLPEFVFEGFEELHEGLANFTLFLVYIHVAGVAFESLVHGENLVRSMITGRKHG